MGGPAMRWTTMVLVAALAVGAAPAVAGNGNGSGVGNAPEAHQRAWLAQRARLAERLPYVPNTGALETWEHWAEVVDAGDLDGDGKNDVFDLRSHLQWDDVAGIVETVRIDAYRGTDGKALWTRSLPPAGYVFPVVTKVGADGKAGVVVLSWAGAGADALVAGGGAGGVTVTSFDRNGQPLWVRSLQGGGAGSLATYKDVYSDVDGVFDAVAGGGTDLLVRTVAAVEAVDPTGTVYEARTNAQFSVLDGATGALRPVGEPVASQWGSYGAPAGDLDGDKLADIVVESDGEDGMSLLALGGASGKRLWSIEPGADTLTGLLPDVTGDGVADLAIQSYGGFGIIISGPSRAADHGMDAEEQVGVLDGKRGRVVWRKPGSYLRALGDIDRKRGAEVLVGNPEGGKSIGFTVGAYTGSGKRLWATKRTLPAPPKGHEKEPIAMINSWGTVGDVHGDGVEEVGYAIRVGDGKKERRDEGTINGRNGKVSRDPKPGMWATRSALDGRGADSYLATASRGVFTVEAWRGDAPARLWTTAVRAPGFWVRSTAMSLNGDKCGDIAMTLLDEEDAAFTSVFYSGGTGKPLWALTRADDADGKTAAASVAKQTTYRRSC